MQIFNIYFGIIIYVWLGLTSWWIAQVMYQFGFESPNHANPIIYGLMWPILPIIIPIIIVFNYIKKNR